MEITKPERIHLVFKTHLDLGFTALAAEVVKQYFTRYIPDALETARRLRAQGSSDRFIWTTGSWLIYEYLEQAAPGERRRMEEAIEAGDICWHGLPFTTHSELMDASLFRSGLRLARRLDERFGKRTIAAKMTDVPGHTRGIVPLLAEAGIVFLHLGVNPASTIPEVPPLFVWKDPATGAEVIVAYQGGSYGGLTMIPDSTTALMFAHTNDNHGPQTLEAVLAVYADLRTRNPLATITASTLDAFALDLLPARDRLPVVTGEIGDTWIHGVGSDPLKVSQFRELSRLRRHWLNSGRLREGEDRTQDFSTALLQVPEHTWGLDEKTYLNDYIHYTPAQLRLLRQTEPARRMEASWREQRAYLQQAIEALGKSPEAEEALQHLRDLRPEPPDMSGWQQVQDWSRHFQTEHFTLGIDSQTGALNFLTCKASGQQWASDTHLLGQVCYEVFAQSDYERFWRQYVLDNEDTKDWARKDLTKPGIESAIDVHHIWQTRLTAVYERQSEESVSVLLVMTLPEQGIALGAPRVLTMELVAPRDEPVLVLNLQWAEKQALRLPEALWCSFQPVASNMQGWSFSKLGTVISPLEVVAHGNRTLHAIDQEVIYTGEEGSCRIETLDAPLLAPGRPSLLDFADTQPDMAGGIHFHLYNNVWGTNFTMWYEEDARFRFRLRFL